MSARSSLVKKDELKPGTKYTVYVKATTVKGDGVGSDFVIVQTPSKGMHEKLDLISRGYLIFGTNVLVRANL